jgi:ribosomal protein S18 acetylase RimI-like enzyme
LRFKVQGYSSKFKDKAEGPQPRDLRSQAIRKKMTINKATDQDLDSLSKLFDDYRVFYQYESDLPRSRAFLSERICSNDSVIYVARGASGALMGFVQLYPLLSSTRMKKLWLLNDLYIHPAYRGLKVSVMLIDKAKQLTKETKAAGLLLETAKSNTVGNNLYLKTDFVLDTKHNYYTWNH